MASIQEHLDKIKNAIFGKEVRQSIHDGLNKINQETEITSKKQEKLERTFDELIINAGNSNAEVVLARNGFETLGKRLDGVDSQLDNILYLAENYGIKAEDGFDNSTLIQNMIDSLQDGARIKFPNGKIQIDNDIDFKGKSFDIVVTPTTEFVGNGKFPMFETNDHHMRTGTSFNRYPQVGKSDGGFNNYADSALNVEMIPKEGYRGNAVGLFIIHFLLQYYQI